MGTGGVSPSAASKTEAKILSYHEAWKILGNIVGWHVHYLLALGGEVIALELTLANIWSEITHTLNRLWDDISSDSPSHRE